MPIGEHREKRNEELVKEQERQEPRLAERIENTGDEFARSVERYKRLAVRFERGSNTLAVLELSGLSDGGRLRLRQEVEKKLRRRIFDPITDPPPISEIMLDDEDARLLYWYMNDVDNDFGKWLEWNRSRYQKKQEPEKEQRLLAAGRAPALGDEPPPDPGSDPDAFLQEIRDDDTVRRPALLGIGLDVPDEVSPTLAILALADTALGTATDDDEAGILAQTLDDLTTQLDDVTFWDRVGDFLATLDLNVSDLVPILQPAVCLFPPQDFVTFDDVAEPLGYIRRVIAEYQRVRQDRIKSAATDEEIVGATSQAAAAALKVLPELRHDGDPLPRGLQAYFAQVAFGGIASGNA